MSFMPAILHPPAYGAISRRALIVGAAGSAGCRRSPWRYSNLLGLIKATGIVTGYAGNPRTYGLTVKVRL